ncbi:hypothetical protein [Bradyrhizobium sp. ARR65]|uniref:hypothetical protein n=1 Tax=Bradyrhizobium sp. ARR65 TaxID=1040989 RepID=UPI000A623478|nr:hypothetical protein [Bradyrhizobium sp. ARR65]
MVTSRSGSSYMGSAPAERQQKKPGLANSGSQCGPMTQQGTMAAHSHDMHPQGFLRLIGVHEPGQKKQDVARRLHA